MLSRECNLSKSPQAHMNDSIAQAIEVFVSLLDFQIMYGCTNSKFSFDYGMIILLCYNKLQENDAHKKC